MGKIKISSDIHELKNHTPMLFRPLGSVRNFNRVQEPKNASPIVSTESGIDMSVKLTQSCKKSSSIRFNALESLICFKDLQLCPKLSSIVVTLSDIEISQIAVQCAQKYPGMVSTRVSKFNSNKEGHPYRKFVPIFVRFFDIFMPVK
jgi:hypothetical protein